ncbi:family 20 glycosylhydrolase [Microbacterium sp. BWT-B31]|uniref:beta-N-acetylhexosaminidase n=1 Tax=Microbacterium sp. BWT-B31 TaxID=3232072 RepID=UPI00352986B2
MSVLGIHPAPKSVETLGGRTTIAASATLHVVGLDRVQSGRVRDCVERLLDAVGIRLEGSGDEVGSGLLIGVMVVGAARHSPQEYALKTTDGRIEITARTAAGVSYALTTLAQLLRMHGRDLPHAAVEDWPDFPARGLMLDISRDKVPTLETLKSIIDLAADWKLNELQLYTEHTFAYQDHGAVWQGSSALTGSEIRELEEYCRERFIELVPNQNSLGHMERWLIHPGYHHLGELPNGAPPLGPKAPQIHPAAPVPYGTTLCPTDDASLTFLRGIYEELLPNFTSRRINVGCDEPYDIVSDPTGFLAEAFFTANGRSHAATQKLGWERVYLDFVNRLADVVDGLGHSMQIWGDVVTGSPELVAGLAEGITVLEWGYEAGHPFAERTANLAAAGVPFYVCPGTSTWGSIGGRSVNAAANLREAARTGLENGAVGYLITDWGSDGHRQFLPISWTAITMGAACAWNLAAVQTEDVPQAVSEHVFRDDSGASGRIAWELGTVADGLPARTNDSTILGQYLRYGLEQIRAGVIPMRGSIPSVADLRAAADIAADIAARIPTMQMAREDSALVQRELQLTTRLQAHACMRAIAAMEQGARGALAADIGEIAEEYELLWAARNRPGGLDSSVGRMHALRAEYLA